jgi:hypothetical protein
MKLLRVPLYTRPITTKPRDRIPSDTWTKADFIHECFGGVFILLFAVTLMAAWSFHFPTAIERTLWRAASTFNLFFSTIGAGYIWLWEYFLEERSKKRRGSSSVEMACRPVMINLRKFADPLDPELEIPLTLLIPITLLCATYCIARVYIIAEDFAGLRSMPASAFETVSWSDYIPHL